MKVAILGVWHVHADEYTRTALEKAEVVGVYDDNPVWRADFAKKHGICEFSSLDELLSSEAEGVIVCTATSRHVDVMVAAARVKKHIFTEKVLALDNEDAKKIKAAVIENGVRFVISYPWKYNKGIMAAKKAFDGGAIGKANFLRFRNCHNGSTAHWLPAHFYNAEECGGGAMIDLGAHGMYLAHWFLGEPTAYKSAFTHFCRDEKDAELNKAGLEDNAVTVMSYGSGAIAINETGFVSVCSPTRLEIGGETGYITVERDSALLVNQNGKTELALGEGGDSSLKAFLRGETAEGCGIEEAVVLTRMMVGAYGNM